MTALLLCVALAGLVSGTAAQVLRSGPCPPQDVINPFNTTAYLGKWHQVKAYFTVFSNNAICIAANYSDIGNDTIRVYNTQFDEKTLTFSYIEGTARLINGTEAKLAVGFPIPGEESPYWVLDTDYVNYAIVWSCREYGKRHFEAVWFLARKRKPTSAVRDKVKNFLEKRKINTDDLVSTRQTECPSEPQPRQ